MCACTVVADCFCFFFNDTATTEIYTLSLHDALPICVASVRHGEGRSPLPTARPCETDRKSTRLNSSHTVNSYAVFCLKKNKQKLAIGFWSSLATLHGGSPAQ